MLSPARWSLYASGLLLALPFLQPYHRFPLTSFYSEWLAFALGLLAALLLLRRSPGPHAEYPSVALAPLGLVLLLVLQTVLGRVPYPEQALIAALYLLWAALLMALGYRLRQELALTSVTDTLAWFAFAAGLLNSLAGLIQHYELATPIGFLVTGKASAAVFGNLAQPNHYAAHIAVSIASAAYLFGRGRLPVLLAIAGVAVFLFVTALAGSRSPWLYFAVLTLLALLLHRLCRTDETRRLAGITLFLLPGFLLAQGAVKLFAPAGGSQVTSLERVFSSASGIAARVQLWAEAWQMFIAAPVLGSGWGQFSWHHFLNQAANGPGAAAQPYNNAHNLALHLLAETGLAGFAVIFGAAAIWLLDLRRVRVDPGWWWVLALLSVVAIHSMLEYPLWYSIFLGPAALLVGLGAQRAIRVRFLGALRLAIAAGILVGALNLFGVLTPYRAFEQVLFSPGDETRPPVRQDQFMTAIALAHREPLLTPYAELAIAYGVVPSRENLKEKIGLTKRAMRFAPVEVVVYRLAALLALEGEPAAAARQLQWAMRAYPSALHHATAQLQALAREYPAEITPLLELAAAKRAQRRTPAAK